MARRVWVTRAQPGAEATAARLRAMGLEPVIEPVLETRPKAGVAIDLMGVDALAFTSAAGVSAFAALSNVRALRVFAVGDATAEAARAAGFGSFRSAGGGAIALADLIADAAPRPALVLNPTAVEPAADLAALLAERGVTARSVAVYESREAGLAAAPKDIAAVLIHSAKAAGVVARLTAGQDLSGVLLCAISAAAARPLADAGFGHVAVADAPNDAALLQLLSFQA